MSDGAFTPDGTFLPLPPLDAEPFEKLWQRKVFDLLLKRGKIDEALVTQMLGWHHSGFDVNCAARLDADDVAGRQRLAQYMLRCPFSLQRLIRVTEQGTVLYRAEKNDPQRFPRPAGPDLFNGVSRNFQVFDPLDFIAELTQHIPEPRKHLTRYFGWYSSAARGRRAKAHATHDAAAEPDHDPISSHQARRRWAALIKHIWKVDPLVCTRCGERMKIVSFISPTQQQVIEKILTHCGLADQPSRAPPAEPDPARLRYVSEPPFVDEPAPAELVWTAD